MLLYVKLCYFIILVNEIYFHVLRIKAIILETNKELIDNNIALCNNSAGLVFINNMISIPFSRGSSHPWIESRSPALQANSLPSEPPGALSDWLMLAHRLPLLGI